MVDYDIIIAGAGTGGSTAAYTLAKKGHSVLLVDRKAYKNIGDKTCGDALGQHHIDELKHLVGLPNMPDHIIEHEVNGIDLIAPDREHRLRMTGPTTKGFSFNRLKMGQWFVSLAEGAGVELRSSTRAKRLILEGGKVTGVIVSEESSSEDTKLRARIVIDATGATGVLRRQLPESSPIEKTIDKSDMMVAWRDVYRTPEYTFETPDILEIYYDQEQTLGGYTWVFPQGKHRVNVGLGLMTLPGHKPPQEIFDSFVRPTWDFMQTELVTIDSSGGIAPIRRPIDTLVDNNFMLVGDAGCQVNPIHGGGIGSSMLGGAYAGITASEALENNDTSIESLWPYNKRYMEAYGKKQASLDIFRWYLLKVTNEEINFAFKKEIVKAEDMLGTSMSGKMEIGTSEKFKRLIAGFGKLPFLLQLSRVANLMGEVREVCSNYPESPDDLQKWKSKLLLVYQAVKAI